MITLIDIKKLPLNEVKKMLEKDGFKRTTSRRYIRFERAVGDNIEGVELGKFDSFTSIESVYVRYTKGYTFNNECEKLSKHVRDMFEPYAYHVRDNSDNDYVPDFNEQGQINNGFNMHNID